MKKAYRPLPSQERLHQLFDYSVTTGFLYRRSGRTKGLPVASQARRSRYPTVWVDGSIYLVHRLVWKWVTGHDPQNLHIDHADGDRTNNAWHNLRLATVSENLRNAKRHHDNTSGFKGVYRAHDSSRWVARITHNRKGIYLGRYNTPEEAHAAYLAAAEQLHGEFARAA
jgi:hypothetical protein